MSQQNKIMKYGLLAALLGVGYAVVVNKIEDGYTKKLLDMDAESLYTNGTLFSEMVRLKGYKKHTPTIYNNLGAYLNRLMAIKVGIIKQREKNDLYYMSDSVMRKAYAYRDQCFENIIAFNEACESNEKIMPPELVRIQDSLQTIRTEVDSVYMFIMRTGRPSI